MEPPRSDGINLIKEFEDEPSEAIIPRKRDQRQAGRRVEAINIEGVELIQCLVKAFFGFLSLFHCSTVGQNRRAVGTSGSFHEPVGGQTMLLCFETMLAQGAHDGTNVGKDSTSLVISPDLNRFLPLLRSLAVAFHSNFPPGGRRKEPSLGI